MLKRYEEKLKFDETPEELFDHYENTVADYSYWSGRHNMHFGYFRAGMNPFDREGLLEETNRQVMARAIKDPEEGGVIADLGCGLGATIKFGMQNYPRKKFIGATVIPSHCRHAQAEVGPDARILLADYRRLPIDSASIEGCYAIESAVYASGAAKADLITEISRILKPGGRAVFFDCFLKCPAEKLPRPIRSWYEVVCSAWALPEMAQIEKLKEEISNRGLKVTECRDISWNVAPCVAHAPYCVFFYWLGKFLRREKLTPQTKRHLKACISSVFLGLWRPGFSYFLVTAEKNS